MTRFYDHPCPSLAKAERFPEEAGYEYEGTPAGTRARGPFAPAASANSPAAEAPPPADGGMFEPARNARRAAL